MRKTLLSPAKVNLGLTVVGRREDGFHCLESLFWPVTFGDSISIHEGSGRVALQWHQDAPFRNSNLPAENENIVTKVLRSLKGFENRWDIKITKKIPMGGGLGGGSSNIGTILNYFSQNNPADRKELALWSAQFGADIPFFIFSRPAWVTGIGEKIEILEIEASLLNKLHLLLISFPFGCETKSIFQHFKKEEVPFSKTQNPFPQGRVTEPVLIQYLATAKNDLEPIVSKLYPEVGAVIKKLKEQDCIYSGLSGSGATCFAVFDSFEKREKTAKDLQTFFRLNNCKSIFTETFATR